MNGRQHIDLAEEQLTWTRVVFVTSGDSINTLHHPGGLVRCFMAECIWIFQPSHSCFLLVVKILDYIYTVFAGNLLSATQSKHESSGLTLEGTKGSPSNVSFKCTWGTLSKGQCVLGLETWMLLCLFVLKQGLGSGNNSAGSSTRKPSSNLMPYPLLFNAISSKIDPKAMDLITAYYQQLRVCSSKDLFWVLASFYPHVIYQTLCPLDRRRSYLERDFRRSCGWLLEMMICWEPPLQLFNACHTLLLKWNRSQVAIKDGVRKMCRLLCAVLTL